MWGATGAGGDRINQFMGSYGYYGTTGDKGDRITSREVKRTNKYIFGLVSDAHGQITQTNTPHEEMDYFDV